MRLFRHASVTSLFFLALLALSPQDKGLAKAGQASGRMKDTTIPFQLVNRDIYIQVSINNSKPLWFILDTGDKYAAVDLALARSLGVEFGDQVAVGGGGKNVVMGNFVKNTPFSVLGLTGFSQPLFIAIPLGDLAKASGQEIAGILGFDFISQFIIEIDYQKKTLTLHDKADYQYRGEGVSLPLSFNNAAHPEVHAMIIDADTNPIEGTFTVDIGSGAALILNKPFVEQGKFLRADRPTIPWIEGRAFGGEIPGLVGRVKGLKLGPYVIDSPVAVFSKAESGAFAATDSQGNIGAAILQKFKIILDYAGKRIMLEPNSDFAKPIEYNRTGLFLVGSGDDRKGFPIEAVLENSPASEAGIRQGDLLTGIDGLSALEYSLSEIRTMFGQMQECELIIQRGEETRKTKLKLRRLI